MRRISADPANPAIRFRKGLHSARLMSCTRALEGLNTDSSKKYRVFAAELPPLKELVLETLEPYAEVSVRKAPHDRSESELIKNLQGMNGLIVTSTDKVTSRVIRETNLKVIGKFGTGIDNVDLDAATEKGVVAVYTPGVNAEAVAEHTVALTLAVLRKIPQAMAHLVSGGWRGSTSLVGGEVAGRCVGIVGFGRVGKRVAEIFAGFRAKVVFYDPHVDQSAILPLHVEKLELEDLLRESDIICLNCALTEETRRLISEANLNKMKKEAIIVNTSRGQVIDEKALINALESGRIAGAGLDVFEKEPPTKENRLFALPNVIVTPHLGGSTIEARKEVNRKIAECVRDVLLDRAPPREYVANPQVLAHLFQ